MRKQDYQDLELATFQGTINQRMNHDANILEEHVLPNLSNTSIDLSALSYKCAKHLGRLGQQVGHRIIGYLK